jgi:hypothetical protein
VLIAGGNEEDTRYMFFLLSLFVSACYVPSCVKDFLN